MANICIMHYVPKKMKVIIEIMKNYHPYANVDISVILSPKYELEYFIRNRNIDVVIIDSDHICNNYDGVFLAERIKVINRKTLVIFLSETKDNDFLIRLINSEPFAYINFQNLKADLPKTLDKAISIIAKDTCVFTYIKRGEKYFVSLENIIYFVSSHRTIQFICVDNRTDVFYEKMNDLENIISKISGSFIRINQSYLVNTKFILSFNSNEVTMITGENIRISRKYHHNLEVIKSIHNN